MIRRGPGFTIVELLIVIVVIAILAAISVVAYNGVAARANYSKARDDLATIRKAIELYKAENGHYPISQDASAWCNVDWCGWDQQTGDAFIPGLSPKYLKTIPQLPASNADKDTFLYQSKNNGEDFQLIRFKVDGLSDVEKQNNELLMAGQGYDGLGWGYKSNAGDWW